MIIDQEVPVLVPRERVRETIYFGFRKPLRPPVSMNSFFSRPAVQQVEKEIENLARQNSPAKKIAETKGVQPKNLVEIPTSSEAKARLTPHERRDIIRAEAVRNSTTDHLPTNQQFSTGRSYRSFLNRQQYDQIVISQMNRECRGWHKRHAGQKPVAKNIVRFSLADMPTADWFNRQIEDSFDLHDFDRDLVD